MATKTTTTEEKKGGGKKGIIIAFVSLLLATNIGSLYFNWDQNNTIKEKEKEIAVQIDSISGLKEELNKQIADLTAARDQIVALNGNVDSLNAAIASLESVRDAALSDAKTWKSRYYSIKNEIEGAKKKVDEANLEIEKYKKIAEEKAKEVEEKNQVILQKDQNINTLTQTNTDLSKKVAIASILRAENVNAVAISSKGKENISLEFKAKGIDQLKIGFTIAENKVAEKNTKELFIRVIEPDGATINNPQTGGGEFTVDGKSLFYSVKYSMLYNGNLTPVVQTYKKDGAWKVGKHTIEIYCEGKMIGSGSFTVK